MSNNDVEMVNSDHLQPTVLKRPHAATMMTSHSQLPTSRSKTNLVDYNRTIGSNENQEKLSSAMSKVNVHMITDQNLI